MKQNLSVTDANNADNGQITDKKGYARRWLFSPRHVDNLIARGLPCLRVGKRRVRILVNEADRWMVERYGTQRRGKEQQTIPAEA